VGIPSFLVPPFAFGISTCLTGRPKRTDTRARSPADASCAFAQHAQRGSQGRSVGARRDPQPVARSQDQLHRPWLILARCAGLHKREAHSLACRQPLPPGIERGVPDVMVAASLPLSLAMDGKAAKAL
jgi:hypothetical protein